MKSAKTKSCNYCQGNVREPLPDDSYVDLEIWVDDDNTLLVVDHNNETSTHININYCPICGRKLRR